jgi:DNA-binding PadR family transcriptional regulator
VRDVLRREGSLTGIELDRAVRQEQRELPFEDLEDLVLTTVGVERGRSPRRPSISTTASVPPLASPSTRMRARLSMNQIASMVVVLLISSPLSIKLRIGVLSSERLTPFSYVVLALIGEGGAGPDDLPSMMRRGSIYWAAAESQWYGEPKRLERLGLLRSQKRPGKTGPRTHYLLTPKGRDALRAWLAEPSSLPRMQNEAIVRVLAGDLGDDESLRASLDGMHADIERARSNLEAAHVAAARSRIAAATWTSSSATAARSSTCTSAGSTRPRGSSAAHPESADGGRGSGPRAQSLRPVQPPSHRLPA